MLKRLGLSQQALVDESVEPSIAAKRFPQYIAGISATLGALAAGLVLAWSSAAGKNGAKLAKEYDIELSATEFSWIGSLVTLGAASICVPIGILSDMIGRKTAMLILVVPFTIGWLLIILANSVTMFYIGRFTLGLSGGAFCVTAPMYTAEIAESSIRGTLGSYFQLMLTVGILLSYAVGPLVSIYYLSVLSAVVPIVFFCVFLFMPESPTYYLQKGDRDAAKKSFLELRGEKFNVEPELRVLEEQLAEAKRNKMSFLQALKGRAAIKGIIIAYGLMFFQQLSGINAIIFYAGSIFESADKSISPNVSALVVGVIQVVAVFLSTLVVDKLGRRILLLVSIFIMMLNTFVLGVYFYLQLKTSHDVTNIGWLPLLSVCIFIFLFSMGFGPIPWMMMGELFSSTVKGVAGSSACLFNWLMAFIVTKYYPPLEATAGAYTCFWIFCAISVFGTVFVFFFVPETKGKSLDEIQELLGSSSREASNRSNRA